MLERMLHHKLLTEGEQGQGMVTKTHDEENRVAEADAAAARMNAERNSRRPR